MLARDGGGVMSRRFRASSGSYNVRASEIAREKQERRMRCLVAFLDDSEHIFEVEVKMCAESRAREEEWTSLAMDFVDFDW